VKVHVECKIEIKPHCDQHKSWSFIANFVTIFLFAIHISNILQKFCEPLEDKFTINHTTLNVDFIKIMYMPTLTLCHFQIIYKIYKKFLLFQIFIYSTLFINILYNLVFLLVLASIFFALGINS